MYESIIKMTTLNEVSHTDWDGKPFWGLVQQNGPWKTTESDRKRAAMKDKPSVGGGKAAGGRAHAGHGEYMRVFTPYQINASGSLPDPSRYAMRSVVTLPIDMKRQTKMGRVKKGLTLAARTPIQSGEKMGLSTLTENIEHGQRLGTAPAEVLPDLLASTVSEMSVDELPPIQQTAPFLSEHHVSEWIGDTLAHELQRDVEAPPPKLGVSKRASISIPPSRPKLSVAQGEKVFLAPSRSRLSVARGETVSIKPEMEIEDVDNIVQLAVKVEEPPVTTFKPPHLHLGLSESFLKSIADYEEGRTEKRKKVMAGKAEPVFTKPVAVPSREGKKQAMSQKALAKEAEKRGLTFMAKKSGVIPEKPKKVINAVKIKPVKKKTVQAKPPKYQPVTVKTVKALRKRLGDTKIRTMLRAMKESNPQYQIFKAAHQEYMTQK